ncbi:DUF4873 domain-containing protein [Rhodococcus chondri]|uniref:DUF4873 domain-containing protein n=1 Tax=Rhodococcus chondri TaxID=3065941 RepID=A0ABU7JQF1_9NOCA|nr:DUF4873 domain-containing protein [Rhodococcus sp. CC-R104]MEE2032065.1 DUF4873 domain-containing protein [Rhodococcus sp. CC-R104]
MPEDVETSPGPDDEAGGYRGPAEITVHGTTATIDIELSGRFDPIRGRHLWRGRLRKLNVALPSGTSLTPGTELTIAVPRPDGTGPVSATARISEIDLWGSHMVDGTSPPPYETLTP